MAYHPHQRGRHCQHQIADGEPHHRQRRSKSCPCSSCRLSRRPTVTASPSSNRTIAWPNIAKKQPMTSAAVNTNKLRQVTKIHPRASQAYLPSVHGPAEFIMTSGSDQEKQSPIPNDNLKDTVASLERDFPLTPPSPSRIIKISTTSNDDEDDENVENRAYDKREYDLVTWRMCKLGLFMPRHSLQCHSFSGVALNIWLCL